MAPNGSPLPMLTFNHRVLGVFDNLIAARKEEIGGSILAGMLPSMEQYKHMTGQLYGLREARELLVEAISICEGRPHDEKEQPSAPFGDAT